MLETLSDGCPASMRIKKNLNPGTGRKYLVLKEVGKEEWAAHKDIQAIDL